MKQLGVDEEIVENISVGLDRDNGFTTFAQHEVPLHYGGFLALALEDAIVPMIDPSASTLTELLRNAIDCEAVGQAASDFIGIPFITPNFMEGACEVGLEAAGNIIMKELRDIDEHAGGMSLLISGETTMKDMNGDRKADKMVTGKWKGAMDYLGELGELAENNPFTGARTK